MISPVQIHVRFSDLDVFGHVNNGIYLSYFEIARVHYFKYLLGVNWDWNKEGFILANNSVDYYKPVLLNDEPYIQMFTKSIGTKSFTLGYELKVNDSLYTVGSSILVSYDSESKKSIAIPNEMKKALESLKRV